MGLETTDPKHTLDFLVFIGPTYQEMANLVAAGLVPASAMQIMRGWLDGRLDREWYHDSGDAIVNHPDGRVKLIHDSADLCKLSTENLLRTGALVLPAGAWDTIDGEVFSKEEIARHTGRRQSRDDAKSNPFWLWLARDDKTLLGEYVDKMFCRIKERFEYDIAMGVFIRNSELHVPTLRQWYLGGDIYCGDAGSGGLGDSYGRLVGV